MHAERNKGKERKRERKKERNIISYLKYFSCRVHSCIRSMWRLIRVDQNTSLPSATNQGARKRSETNERAPRGPVVSLRPRAGKISLLPRNAGRTRECRKKVLAPDQSPARSASSMESPRATASETEKWRVEEHPSNEVGERRMEMG